MATCIGFVLILGIAVGGVYLYYKVVRLDREIASQHESALVEAEDDDG